MKGSNNLEDLQAEVLVTQHFILSLTRNLDWIVLVANIWVPWESENLFISSATTGTARLLSCNARDATECPRDSRPLANVSQCVSNHKSPICHSVTQTTHHQSLTVWFTTHHQSPPVWLTPRITNLHQCDSHHASPISHIMAYHASPIFHQYDSHHASPISTSVTHTTHQQSLTVWLTPHIPYQTSWKFYHLEACARYNF